MSRPLSLHSHHHDDGGDDGDDDDDDDGDESDDDDDDDDPEDDDGERSWCESFSKQVQLPCRQTGQLALDLDHDDDYHFWTIFHQSELEF